MVLDTVISAIFKAIDGLVSTFLKPDNIFFIGLGFTVLMVLFFFIKSAYSYESKLERAVNKLNVWLFKHQTLTENNLLDFNTLIKSRKTPKILRKHWQQYMLYRDKLPSEYMSSYNCIDKPAKTSSFKSNIRNFIAIYITTAIITFALTLMYYKNDNLVISNFSRAFITPSFIILIGLIFTLILRSMQNYNLASLYQTFHIFNRYIDKASVTIPKYVDFEILFTKKEIKNGIPILGEYLEKRARQEQEELEEAQRNAVSHEEYDFASSGVDGSLVLDRAMKESETYLNFKQRTLAEIQQFESEISTLKKNFENTSKDYQRKLQASKENMERLRQQQEESTNRIEVNYIRKQQQDEVKKQEILERDQEDATNKFNAEINSLSEEIEKRRVELENKKQKVQEAMEHEYQTFSAKLHKTISNDLEKISSEAISKISTEKDQYAQAITYLKTEVDNKDEIINAKDQIIAELQSRLGQANYNDQSNVENQPETKAYTSEEYVPENTEYNPETEEYIPEQSQEQNIESEASDNDTEQDLDGHYDENGYYWFEDNTYYDAEGLYHDLQGNVFDEEGNLLKSNQIVEKENTSNTEINQTQEEVSNNQDEVSEELNVIPQPETEDYTPEEYVPETEEFVPETTEFIPETEEYVPEEQEENNPSDETENIKTSEEASDGHYDDNGYYWFNDKTYYDSNGLYHTLDGNVYDSEGNLIYTDQIVEQESAIQNTNDTSQQDLAENISNLTEEIEQPTKRKAGRPRKEVNPEEANKPKRSVGRPRKEVNPEEENKPKRSVGRPRKEVDPEEANKPKRSVGRPRKEVNPEEENKPKRSVGRPRKEVNPEEENKPKRKVGRPKKSESNETHMDILKELGKSLIEVTEKKKTKRSAKKS